MSFVSVLPTKALPIGKTARVQIDGHPILLANVDGELFAIDDVCNHEDASLYLGALHGDCVSCPLHGSRFSLRTGAPLEPPATEPVKCYPVQSCNGQIQIEIAR